MIHPLSQKMSVADDESSNTAAAAQTLLQAKLAELDRLKALMLEAEAAKAAEALPLAEELSQEEEVVLPGGVPMSTMPHWRTYGPCIGMLLMTRENLGLSWPATFFTILCLMVTVFLGQKLINRIENSEWRRNLRRIGSDAVTLGPKEAKKKDVKPGGNPKKKKAA